MIPKMVRFFEKYAIYDYSDEEIVAEICRRVKQLRKGCRFSQQSLANASGVSVATIKRIDSGQMKDMNIMTLIQILRATGSLGGVADLVPDVPDPLYKTKIRVPKL